jgi:phosphatidylglycerophosphatase A
MQLNPKILTGTFFGAGLIPKAPGTWASLFTLPLVYAAWLTSPQFGIPFLAVLTITLSLWSSEENIHEFGDDPPQFVMDECAGQTVVFLPAAVAVSAVPDLFHMVTGFFLFRVFDILKPLGIDRLQKLPGKFGILADDLLAGIYALITLELIRTLTATLI